MQNDGSVSAVRQFLRNRWVRAILVIDVVALIAVIGVAIWNSTKSVTVNFNVTPIDATIQIDGQGSYQNGSYQIHPGTHDITITHDGLISKAFTIDTGPDYVSTITTFLAGEGADFSFYTFRDNYESYQKLVSIASKGDNLTTDQDTSAEPFITNFQHILSISGSLPIKGYVYADPSINSPTAGFEILSGSSGCEKIACLLVSYAGSGLEDTVARKIKEAGYNPADYQLVYERYGS